MTDNPRLSQLQLRILIWLAQSSDDEQPRPWLRSHPFPNSTNTERAVLSRSLSRLDKRGLVTRTWGSWRVPCPNRYCSTDHEVRRYGTMLSLTEAGRETANKRAGDIVSQSESAPANLTDSALISQSGADA